MYKAALDNMAGEAVGVLFASMADRAMGIDVDSNNSDKQDKQDKRDHDSKPGGRGDEGGRGGPTTADEKPGTRTADETEEKKQEPRRSGNQAEEESGPGEEGRSGSSSSSGNQQAEGNGEEDRAGMLDATVGRGGGEASEGGRGAPAGHVAGADSAGAIDAGVSRWVLTEEQSRRSWFRSELLRKESGVSLVGVIFADGFAHGRFKLFRRYERLAFFVVGSSVEVREENPPKTPQTRRCNERSCVRIYFAENTSISSMRCR